MIFDVLRMISDTPDEVSVTLNDALRSQRIRPPVFDSLFKAIFFPKSMREGEKQKRMPEKKTS